MDTKSALLLLADTYARHHGITHWAVSMRALGKGDFFQNLRQPNRDCRTRTAQRLLDWFDRHWPEDLEWPQSVPRPSKKREVA